MIKSMTGFANGVLKIDSELSYAIELRSVNNRYFDFNLRIEDDLKYLETKIKALLNVKIKRGKIDCRIIKSIS
ncbi:MAG: YicC/YloC family endoribonuclease, partial [Methylophilaceae bacterium]